MDAVKRQYERMKESNVWKRNDYATYNTPFSTELLELCQIDDSLSSMERRMKRLFPASAPNISLNDSENSNQLMSIVEEAKRDSTQIFKYTVVAHVDMVSEEMVNEVDEVKKAVHDLQSIVICLKEACDGQYIGDVLNRMDHIAEIISPAFLRKMRVDYTVIMFCFYNHKDVLNKFIPKIENRSREKKKEDDISKKLREVEVLAENVLNDMKRVTMVVFQLHQRRRELEELDRTLSNAHTLLQQQEQCIQLLKEDALVLKNVSGNAEE